MNEVKGNQYKVSSTHVRDLALTLLDKDFGLPSQVYRNQLLPLLLGTENADVVDCVEEEAGTVFLPESVLPLLVSRCYAV